MRIIKHFITITKHRHMVMHYCFKAHLFKQGLKHDLSKYSFQEFIPSATHYTDGTHSPTEEERLEYGYSKAWLHHKGRNKHHSEYWQDYSPVTGVYEPVPMPKKYVIENFCDRIAASRNYAKKNYKPQMALDYFLTHQEHLKMHEETKKQIEFLLRYYVNNGEKAVFKYIRKEFLKK